MSDTSLYTDFIHQAQVAESELENNEYMTNIKMFTHSSDFIMNNGCVLVETDIFLRREPYTLNKTCLRNIEKKSYVDNDCIGYECLEGSFLYDPDKTNTYHNYPVLQEEKHNDLDVFCTENHQVFYNLTRRSDAVQMPERPINPAILDAEKIPELQFNECKITYPKPNCPM
jgi:hypothetical protein